MSTRAFYPPLPRRAQPLTSGQWRCTSGPIQYQSAAVGQEKAQLLWLLPGQQLQAAAVYVGTGVASTSVRIGIRADAAGQPAALLLDCGTVTVDVAGARTVAFTYTVPNGAASGVPLWVTATVQGSNPVSLVHSYPIAEVRDFPSPAPLALLGHGGFTAVGVTGALPADFTVGGTNSPYTTIAVQAA